MRNRIWLVTYLLKENGEIKGKKTAVECMTAGDAYKHAVRFVMRNHGPKSSMFVTDIGQADEGCRELIGKESDLQDWMWDASDWPEEIG